MLIFLFYCTVILLAIELSYIGKVLGFFQKKIIAKDIVKLSIASLITVAFLALGSFVGYYGEVILVASSLWYASTVLFIMGLKMFYNGAKLHKVKQLINPIHINGLLTLSTLVGLNSFFIGLSFGLIQIPIVTIYTSIGILFMGILLGYLAGLKLKVLNPHRYEFLLGFIYIIISIVLLLKYQL